LAGQEDCLLVSSDELLSNLLITVKHVDDVVSLLARGTFLDVVSLEEGCDPT